MALNNIKAKMESLRLDADKSAAEADELKGKVKTLEQDNLSKEQELKSLTHKNSLLEAEVEKLDADLKKSKDEAASHHEMGSNNEALNRRLQLLEEEAEAADKTTRETNEKLRLTDVKAGHYERKVQALEAARDQWEEKYEEMAKKYATAKKELEDFQIEMGNI